MFGRVFARRIVTFVLALGVFLGGVAPSWAMPGKASMSGMTMQSDCMAMMDKHAPSKGTPCKSPDMNCGVCTSCALPVGLVQNSSPVQFLDRGEKAVFTHDVNRSGIANPPALPPPILRA
ncbi:MAG: hypothetical protein JSR55_14310 [Proteobacteria bacterium]|nr:hypothetical protein [Pseudomonadota bacterium]